MLNVGTPELLLILLVALVVLGPAKLPEAARQVGRAVAELRRMSTGFQAELRDAMKEPVNGSSTITRSPTPLATPAPTPEEELGDDDDGRDAGAAGDHDEPPPANGSRGPSSPEGSSGDTVV